MASINVRKETGKLYIDFRYRNIRCREQTNLVDSPQNRRRLQPIVERLSAEITFGSFDYAKFFPDSPKVKLLKELEAKCSEGLLKIPTFESFALVWLSENNILWSDSYKATANHILRKRLIPFFGNKKVDKINKASLLQFRAELAQTVSNSGKCLSPTHVNRHMKILRSILIEASDRFEFKSQYRGIKPLKVPKTDISPLSPQEIQLILQNVRKDFREYFCIRIFTGMRTGEVDGLKWKYVDIPNRVIKIRETIVNGKTSYTKNDYSQRDIQMSEPVYQAFLAMRPRTHQFDYVFTNTKGQPLHSNNVTRRVWYPLLQHLGLTKRVPYQMRHTAATLWLASGENPEWIASQLGHANTEMLFRTYSRYVPNITRQDGSAANRMFESILDEE